MFPSCPSHKRTRVGGPINARLLECRVAPGQRATPKGRMAMKNPLESIWGTIICGLVLTAILYLAVKNFLM
jgi:hypothetical protein